MSNGMLKLFAAAVCSIFVIILLLFLGLPSSTASFGNENDIEWNYAIVIDAGSTGSRLFLYKYRSKTQQELIDIEPVMDRSSLHPVVKKITPGLSSFRYNPKNASVYIKPLLDYAIQFIPLDKHSRTSFFMFATAGMRLLSKNEQDEVLRNLHHDLPMLTSIKIIPEHIKVIEGKWEGIYSWIAVNYILRRFAHDDMRSSRQPTVGIIDMGGASVQIAVELSSTDDNLGKNEEDINLGCKDDERTYSYRLFVATFLGFGVNEALRKYEQKLSDDLIVGTTNLSYIRDPCLPLNLLKTVHRNDGLQFRRKGYGDWDICVDNLTALLKTSVANSDCYSSKCFLGLVPAPPISLSEVELYGFSEYWFSSEDVLSMGGPYDFRKMAMKAHEFCAMKWSTIKKLYEKNVYPKADVNRLQTQCFKSAWITAVLHDGFFISKTHNHFRSVLDVRGQEVHWALGALLYHMRYCPAHETSRNTPQKRFSSQWTMLLILLFVIVLGVLYRSSKMRYLRRDPSIWGYMMLSQDQL